MTGAGGPGQTGAGGGATGHTLTLLLLRLLRGFLRAETPAFPPTSGRQPRVPHGSRLLVWGAASVCSRCWGQLGGVLACTPGPHPALLASPPPSRLQQVDPRLAPVAVLAWRSVANWGPGELDLRVPDIQKSHKAQFWPSHLTPCKVPEHQWGGPGRRASAHGRGHQTSPLRSPLWVGWSWRSTLALGHSSAETEAQRC